MKQITLQRWQRVYFETRLMRFRRNEAENVDAWWVKNVKINRDEKKKKEKIEKKKRRKWKFINFDSSIDQFIVSRFFRLTFFNNFFTRNLFNTSKNVDWLDRWFRFRSKVFDAFLEAFCEKFFWNVIIILFIDKFDFVIVLTWDFIDFSTLSIRFDTHHIHSTRTFSYISFS